MEYLYSQTGAVLPGTLPGVGDDLDRHIDEGFCDLEEVEIDTSDVQSQDPSEDISTFAPPSDSEDDNINGHEVDDQVTSYLLLLQ